MRRSFFTGMMQLNNLKAIVYTKSIVDFVGNIAETRVCQHLFYRVRLVSRLARVRSGANRARPSSEPVRI